MHKLYALLSIDTLQWHALPHSAFIKISLLGVDLSYCYDHSVFVCSLLPKNSLMTYNEYYSWGKNYDCCIILERNTPDYWFRNTNICRKQVERGFNRFMIIRFMAFLGRWISLSFIKIVTILHMILVCIYLATMWYFPQRDIVHKPNQVCHQLASPSPSYLDVFVMPSQNLHYCKNIHLLFCSAYMLTVEYMTLFSYAEDSYVSFFCEDTALGLGEYIRKLSGYVLCAKLCVYQIVMRPILSR